MKGKIGLVVGLGVGYVLGTRAGRERYAQIKTQWLKVWNLDPVQAQVGKVKDYVGDKAAAVPGALWNGVVKVAKSVNTGRTPGEKLDSAIATGRKAAENLAEATDDAVEEAKGRAERDEEKSPTTKAASAKTVKKTGD